MARDQRTRLNSELAHQYSGSAKRGPAVKKPGRNALTGELVEPQEAAPDGVEVEEQELEGEEQEVVEREPKKSLFELPRKEPSRQPLLASPFAAQPAAPPGPAQHAAPAAPDVAPPKTPRRG